MVQIKTRSTQQVDPDETDQNSYWKLGVGGAEGCFNSNDYRDYLKARNFYHEHTSSKERLNYLATRSQRSLLSYQKYKFKELLVFGDARGISMTSRIATTKSRACLLKLLETADEEATFTKFVDLAPELRNLVYKYYFEALLLPAYGAGPDIPPLLLASRQLHAEALPLFFECATFPINFDARGLSSSLSMHHLGCRWHPRLVRSDNTNLAHARHFRVRLTRPSRVVSAEESIHYRSSILNRRVVSVDIDLTRLARPVTLSKKTDRRVHPEGQLGMLVEMLLTSLTCVAHGFMQRSGPLRYDSEADYLAIEEAVRDAFTAHPIMFI